MQQSATSPNKPRYSWQFEAIGTHWSIETTEPLGRLQEKIAKRIETFDATYSRFRDDSLVAKVSQSAGEYHFPSDAKQLVQLYQSLYDATDGAVSPLVGTALSDAGYDSDYSFVERQVRDVPTWNDAMEWKGETVTIKRPVLLDFGAAGKGYLVDLIAVMLERGGHSDFVIDASGDICVRGNVQTVGLENPYDSTSVIGVVNVTQASLCASATNRRAWGKWHHVIDAKTSKPTDGIVATWVMADSTMVADGLATALFFVGPDKLNDWQFEYVRLDKSGHIDKSPGFVGELFV